MKETLPRPCEHGRLKRQCNECDLQAQNDELLVNHLKAHSMNVRLCSSIAPLHLSIEDEELSEKLRLETVKIIDEFRVDNLTKAQSLADIRAEAESKGAIKVLSGLTGNVSNLIKDAENSGNNDLLLSLMFMQRMIKEYANKIKGAE